jgi:hypothetical protein
VGGIVHTGTRPGALGDTFAVGMGINDKTGTGLGLGGFPSSKSTLAVAELSRAKTGVLNAELDSVFGYLSIAPAFGVGEGLTVRHGSNTRGHQICAQSGRPAHQF